MRFLAENLIKAAYKTIEISNLLVCDMIKKDKPSTNNIKSSIWGGRFSSGPSQLMQDINASISYDQRLYQQDIAGSQAHAAMLAQCQIISDEDLEAINRGLEQISIEIRAGEFTFSPELEDIHMNIETRLAEIVGEPALRLHTARSRNDQVATDFKMWVRMLLETIDTALADLQAALLAKAEAHVDTLMPGYTHLQTAQPVTDGTAWESKGWKSWAETKDAPARS